MTPTTIPTATLPATVEAVRIEYAAKVVLTGTIYMHDFNLAAVQDFITDMSTVTPVRLVTRQWAGTTHTAWLDQLLEGTK